MKPTHHPSKSDLWKVMVPFTSPTLSPPSLILLR